METRLYMKSVEFQLSTFTALMLPCHLANVVAAAA